MHGVAAGVHLAGDQHHVADLERAHLLFGERRRENDFAAGEREAFAVRHFFDGASGVAIQPLRDRAGRGIEPHAQTAEGPAIVGHGDEEAGGQAVGRADLAADQTGLAAEAHGADAEAVGLLHDFGFELGQRRVRD